MRKHLVDLGLYIAEALDLGTDGLDSLKTVVVLAKSKLILGNGDSEKEHGISITFRVGLGLLE